MLRQRWAGGQDWGFGRTGQQGHAEQGWKWQKVAVGTFWHKDVPVLRENSRTSLGGHHLALPTAFSEAGSTQGCGGLEEQVAQLLGAAAGCGLEFELS